MADERNDSKIVNISRRNFLKGMGVVTAAAALSTGGFGLLSKADAQEAPTWPFPYKKLDPEAIMPVAYEGYFKGGCAYGAFSAIMEGLRKEVGYPFTVIPNEIVKWGEGGGAGWGTLCGALLGAATAINLVTDAKGYSAVINDLIGWYTQFPFPAYKPANPRADISVTSVSGSPLCHVSVSKWCAAAKAKIADTARKERCGRLTADVAAQAVRLLNSYHSGTFVAAFKPSDTFNGCMSCHGASAMNNAMGKMDCVPCHEPHN